MAGKLDSQGRKQEPRRWRKFPEAPEGYMDWPASDWDDGPKRYLESCGDPIIVYDSCNGYSVWDDFTKPPPPAQWWIAMPPRPKASAG